MSAFDEAAFEAALGLEKEGRIAEAAASLLALTKPVLTLKVAFHLGRLLLQTGDYAQAEHWLGLAARHRPADPAVRMNLGRSYDLQGKIDLADLEYRTALAFDPKFEAARLALSGLLLSVGRYREGWPLMEARAELNPDLVPRVGVSFPEWTGQPLDGKSVLVWYEQGFGDQIQMCRFVRGLKERGAAHVALGARPPLTHLFTTLEHADEIIPVPRGTSVAVKSYDFWTRYFSMPHHLGTTLGDLPSPPYLSAPADRREKWKGYSGIGLAWKASPTGFNGRNKTLPPEQAQRLFDLGVTSLDPDDTGVTDFADTAAIIEQLDLVISIDSAVAHLAGAMGKPVWTLLPYVNTDWRWLRDRSDSPWYPSMRLYRLAAPDDWARLTDQVVADLALRSAAPA